MTTSASVSFATNEDGSSPVGAMPERTGAAKPDATT